MKYDVNGQAVVTLGERLKKSNHLLIFGIISTVVFMMVISSIALTLYSLLDNLTAQAKITAEGLAAPLAFNDKRAADEVVGYAKSLGQIESIKIFDSAGKLFYSYSKNNALTVNSGYFSFFKKYINVVEISEPVIFNQQRIGVIYLSSNLNSFYYHVVGLLCSTIFSIMLAVWIGRRFMASLNYAVTSQIRDLEIFMRDVSRNMNFSVRKGMGGIYEVNLLSRGLNAMLDLLQDRDSELSNYRNKLEQLVVDRTEELMRAKQVAEAANIAKSHFLATMSHEIRTPLTGMLGMNELLLNSNLSGLQREWALDVNASGQQLLRVINDVLDFSKIEAGRMELETVVFDVADLIEDCLFPFMPSAREKDLELVADFSPDSLGCLVRGDPYRLRQVLTNLIDNAIKFTRQGGVLVKLVRDNDTAGTVPFQLSIEDTGIGIDSDAMSRIFNDFTQVDSSTTREFGGTGLGLAICKRLVGLMGGSVRVESQPAGGTKFVIDLRLPACPASYTDTSSVADFQGQRVLLIVNRPFTEQMLRHRFESMLMHVTVVHEVNQALDILGSSPQPNELFDVLLICDAVGLERLADHRVESPGMKVIVLMTASGESDERLPGVAYIHSPVSRQALVKALSGKVQSGSVRNGGQHHRLPEVEGTVLLVEDNPVNQRLCAAMLERLGVQVKLATNGKEALEAFDLYGADLVLMDCQMPVMDGYQATAKLRRRTVGRPRRLPVVALTANALHGDEQNCLNAGMDDFLPKPFTLDQLRQMLERWLPRRAPEHIEVVEVDISGLGHVLDPEPLRIASQMDPDGKDGLLPQLLTAFVTLEQQALRDVEAAVASNDVRSMSSVAHKLKSSASNVGAFRLAALYTEMEMLVRVGHVQQATALMAPLRLAHQQVIDTIEAFLRSNVHVGQSANSCRR